MTVKELIEILQEIPPGFEIRTPDPYTGIEYPVEEKDILRQDLLERVTIG